MTTKPQPAVTPLSVGSKLHARYSGRKLGRACLSRAENSGNALQFLRLDHWAEDLLRMYGCKEALFADAKRSAQLYIAQYELTPVDELRV